MPLYDHDGNAAISTLTATLTNVGLSISANDLSTWPVGGANGKFWFTLGRGTPNEEHCLGLSRSGNTVAISALGDRGLEGTAAVEHPSGTTIEHSFHATEASENNDHINLTALDHHTQYMRADGTRHDLTARHTFGGALPTPGTPTALTPDLAGSAGAAAGPARADHAHAIAAAIASTITGVNAEGASSSFARADHNHLIGGSNHIPGAAIVNDSITAAQMAVNSIGASELANGAVAETADIVDGIITLVKMASEGALTWDVAAGSTNIVVGNGNIQGRYFKLGRWVIGNVMFNLGSTSNIGGEIRIGLPVASANIANFLWLGGARGFVTGGRYAGVGFINPASTEIRGFATAGTAAWNATVPANWANGDNFACFFLYETAA